MMSDGWIVSNLQGEITVEEKANVEAFWKTFQISSKSCIIMGVMKKKKIFRKNSS